jgi:4-hydroxybenzoate polyprenyltransferase
MIHAKRKPLSRNVPETLLFDTPARALPICVDLDGTLVKTDLLLETFINVVKNDWVNLFRVPAWFFLGKAAAKEKLAKISSIDPATIPYNEKLLEYLKKERFNGREIVLATASDQQIARQIALHLGIFDDVVASDGITNLKGEAKANALVERYGERGFAYVGNSRCDINVWRRANAAILVNTGRSVPKAAAGLCPVEREFLDTKSSLKGLIREARPHQWLKNLLVFLSPMAGHLLFNPTVYFHTLLAFVVFCFAASGIYLINDLFDLEADRRHPRKRNRPFASGDLPLQYGLAGPIFIVIAIALGLAVSLEFILIVYIYFTLSLAYSQFLKTKPLVDVFCLAFLYTIRVVAGGVAAESGVSIWLLNFSGFLFLSLGFLKRYAEYSSHTNGEKSVVSSRRGYTEHDSLLIIIMGVCSSFVSTLVFAFYVNSTQGALAYKTANLLWGVVPLVLFWQLRLWLATVRGYMHDDPVVYAAKDKISVLVMAIVVVIYILASIGVPPVFGYYFLGHALS